MNYFIIYTNKIKMNQIILISLYCLAILISIMAIRFFCSFIQKEIEKSAERTVNSRSNIV